MYRFFKAVKNTNKIIVAIFFFLAIISFYRFAKLAYSDNWKHIIGTEYSWIAKNLSNGHGYSFNTNTRWLFFSFRDKIPNEDYFPTAWEEPIYPVFLATVFKLFGHRANLVVIFFQMLALYLTSLLIYSIIKKIFHTDLGIIASIGLLLFWPDARALSEGIFSPSIFAGLIISVLVYLVLSYLNNITTKQSTIIGIALGVACLTFAPFIVVVPITILVIFFANYKIKNQAWKQSLIVLLTFIVTILPWTLRNQSVFGEFVPFRNGTGHSLHMSNNMVAATCFPGNFAYEDSLGPIWKVDDIKLALWEISADRDRRIEIYRRAFDCIQIEAPQNYSHFNEAQRDKIYLKSGLNFIINNPTVFLKLTFNKIKMFLIGWDRKHRIISLLMIIGILLAFKDRNKMIIALIILAYILTFSIIGFWFYRDRYPIEPLMIVLASGFPILLFNWVKQKFLARVNL